MKTKILSKPWKTKEWKEKRALFLIGKVCEWCGSTENLCISHKEILDYRKHIKKLEYNIFRKYIKHYFKDGKNKVELDEYIENDFKYRHREELSKILDEKIQKNNEIYNSFENVMVQCRRCHFAYHKGMDLCPECKTKYKKMRFKTCFNCLPENFRNKVLENNEKILYIHPWCNREIYIESEDWEFESSITLVCIEHCPNKEISYDINSCEIAKKKTNEGEQ